MIMIMLHVYQVLNACYPNMAVPEMIQCFPIVFGSIALCDVQYIPNYCYIMLSFQGLYKRILSKQAWLGL